MSAGYENTIRAAVGGLLRPFPVVKLANEAVNAIPVRLISHRSFGPPRRAHLSAHGGIVIDLPFTTNA